MSSPLLKSHGSVVPSFPNTLKNAVLDLPQMKAVLIFFSGSVKLEHNI